MRKGGGVREEQKEGVGVRQGGRDRGMGGSVKGRKEGRE